VERHQLVREEQRVCEVLEIGAHIHGIVEQRRGAAESR
jgi:hypothetical protein